TKRIPFDMPEGESEIIGYFVEYSGMKFGMLAMADFLETVVIAGLTTSLFLGGWQVPYLYETGVRFPWRSTTGLPHLLAALVLTGHHFFANLGQHIAHALGRTDARGAVTIQYPEERRPMSPRLRSLHRLVRREDGSPRCVACMMCETVCPARCIYIVADEHP